MKDSYIQRRSKKTQKIEKKQAQAKDIHDIKERKAVIIALNSFLLLFQLWKFIYSKTFKIWYDVFNSHKKKF